MARWFVSLAALALPALPSPLWADAFDHYTNPVLSKAPDAAGVKPIKRLTPALIAAHDRVLPGTTAALLVVRTNEGRFAKLLVQDARQKTMAGGLVPILLVERYVTYREGEERAIQASGKNVRLFGGFRLSLDIGQVVPAEVGGDLRFVSAQGKSWAEPVGKAALYLVTKPLPGAVPKKTARPVIGKTFEPGYFTGTYKLHDDGRRSGTLHLKVGARSEVTGSYYSDKDGRKYDVVGKVGPAAYRIAFTIVFPRTRQTFEGLLFTGDGRAITGTSRLQDREAGFYALRVEGNE
jgi:hypothetical protein